METMKNFLSGNDKKASSAEIKSEPMQPYQHESLQCFQCFITFSDYKSKDRHMRKSHRDLYKQQLQQTNTVFTCYKCDRSFDSSDDLSLHQATHDTQEKSFCCPYCQACFFTFSELTRHRRHECTERQCPCKDCGALFPCPSRLRKHRIAVHQQPGNVTDEDNTYQCCKCGGGFKTEEELLHHQEKFADSLSCDVKPPAKKRGRKSKCAIQDEETPELHIPCPEENCDLIFPSISALRAHKKDKHGSPPATQKSQKERTRR